MDLNFKEFGAGEPVVILHGLFGTLDNWQVIAKWLSEHFTVYILDLPNHGRSPHTRGVFDYTEMAEYIAEFMQKNWLYEAHIIGHSMGGKLAMQLALQNPDAVKKLAVIDIAPKRYPEGHEKVFRALFGLDLLTIKDRKEAEEKLMYSLDNDTSTVQFLLKNLSRKPADEGGGFEWKMNLPVLWQNYDKILDPPVGNTFWKKTLFIRGGESDYIEDADLKVIHNLFPISNLITIPDAGHWVHADKPQQLFETVRDFLL
jgi:esterase